MSRAGRRGRGPRETCALGCVLASTLLFTQACGLDFDHFSISDAAPEAEGADAASPFLRDATAPNDGDAGAPNDASLARDAADAGHDAGAPVCMQSTGCFNQAAACGASCYQRDQTCASACTDAACRNACTSTEQSCLGTCASQCFSCEADAGCSAIGACLDAARP